MEYLKRNIPMMTDSYKVTHHGMYPDGTEEVYSYFESRTGARWPYSVFFGLQYLLKSYFTGEVVTREMIEEAAQFCELHFSDESQFNREGWELILDDHDGRLPVEIRAVPEGTVVGESNVLLTIRNTDPDCYWLTNHLETMLVQLWHACTVATSSTAQYLKLKDTAIKTGSDLNGLPFKLHDFGFRGSTCYEAAALGGAGHLIPFMGTDNIAAISLIKQFYNRSSDVAWMPAFSIPAAEHSTITAHEDEVDAYRQILERYPRASVVSDSYDYKHAVAHIWGGQFNLEIKSRLKEKPDNLLVIRPDSGDPRENVLWTLETLAKKFGFALNDKGFKSLPPGLAIIQGDGIDPETLGEIADALAENEWTIDSVVFGSGGGLLQKFNRDTQRFAMKASSVRVYGGYRQVSKAPKTDMTKASKAGKLKLVDSQAGGFVTVREDDPRADRLQTVFRDGELMVDIDFGEVRANWAKSYPVGWAWPDAS